MLRFLANLLFCVSGMLCFGKFGYELCALEAKLKNLAESAKAAGRHGGKSDIT